MKSLHRSFAVSFLATIFVCSAVGHYFVTGQQEPWSRPALPVPGKTYVSAATGGQTDHYLFYFGLFDFGKRMRNADFLMFGSSHMEFDLSAGQLTEAFSTDGRSAVGLNLGLGSAEGMPFAQKIIERNNLTGKLVLLEPFTALNGGLSAQAEAALSLDAVGAYVAVTKIWTDYFRDWLLDGRVVRIAFDKTSGFYRRHFFEQLIVLRDWKTGDVTEAWSPRDGELFKDPPSGIARPLESGPLIGDFWLGMGIRDSLAARRLAPVVVIVPFQGYRPENARRLAREGGFPFVELSSDGLLFWDNNHLTASGRALATAETAREILRRGLATWP
jgi:hypothetical protein